MDKNDINSQGAIDQVLFINHMALESSHFEKYTKKNGCLTINGYNSEKSPVIFSLEYTNLNMKWFINDIFIFFPEDSSDFVTSAKCPQDYMKDYQ